MPEKSYHTPYGPQYYDAQNPSDLQPLPEFSEEHARLTAIPSTRPSLGERVSAHLESPALKKRMNRVGAAVCASMFTAISFFIYASHEDQEDTTRTVSNVSGPSHIYPVTNTEGGVFSRNSPHTEDTPRIAGQGAYDGDQVQLLCGVTNGDAVGPNSNNTWHKVKNLSRPDQPAFFLNDYYIASPNVADQLAPGEPVCEAGSVPEYTAPQPVQPAQPQRELQPAVPPPAQPQTFTNVIDGGSVFYAPGNGTQTTSHGAFTPAGTITLAADSGKYNRWKSDARCDSSQAINFPEVAQSGDLQTGKRITTLAGWSLGRLGVTYFLHESAKTNAPEDLKRKRDNINYIILYDPASKSDFEGGCDANYNLSKLYADWLAEDPNNRLTILAGNFTTDAHAQPTNDKYLHQGIQDKMFAGHIRGTDLAEQVLVCNYGDGFDHKATYELAKDYMNKPKITEPSQCPKLAGAKEDDMIGWRP